MLLSCGDPVQPAAQADQRVGGAEAVPDPVQQPTPAAQRPGVAQVGDRLVHQRAQPGLQAVVGPLLPGKPADGAAVPNRGMPVLAGLGHAAEPAIQQAGDLDAVQHSLQPCQLDELVLVAAARPAAVAPQQVAVDARQRQALGGVGVALGVVQHLLVGPPRGRCTRVPSPSRHTASPERAISPSQRRSWSRLVTKVPSGWQKPRAPSGPSSRSRLSPTSVLEIPTALAARRYDSPSSSTAATASRRTSSDSGGVPPWSGGRGGSSWARRAASQASTSAGSDECGQYVNGDQTSRQV